MFDNIRQDIRSQHGGWTAQGSWVLIVYRFGRWRYRVRPALLRKFLSLIYRISYKLIQIITGIELPCEAEIGKRFVIDHFGGIIISGYAKFGDDCRIRNGVVVGIRRMKSDKPRSWATTSTSAPVRRCWGRSSLAITSSLEPTPSSLPTSPRIHSRLEFRRKSDRGSDRHNARFSLARCRLCQHGGPESGCRVRKMSQLSQ